VEAVDCLVIGHFDMRLEELAARLRPNRDFSGAFSEIRTNSVRVGKEQLSYSELFGDLCRVSWDMRARLNPFDAPHSGAIFLANRLRRAGLGAQVVNFVSRNGEELISALTGARFKVVAITTTFYVEPSPIVELVRFIRSACEDAFIVVGGPFVVGRAAKNAVTAAAELEMLGADAVIFDTQGEQALLTLVRQVSAAGRPDPGGIANVAYWEPGTRNVVTGSRVRESNDLDDHRVRWSDFTTELTPRLAFLRTARGCSFRCAFCNYPAMAGGHDLAGIGAACDELEELAGLGVGHVAFVDDTFNVPLPRFKALMREIARRDLGLHWTSFFRCSNADEEAFDLMAAAGCEAVFLGIESGDPAILTAMNKAARVANYERGIRALRQRGIMTMASYIIGFPGETKDSVQRTLDFIGENPTDFHNVQLYFHDRMAPIEARRAEFSLTGSEYSWDHATMDWREAADWVEYAMSTGSGSIPLPLYGFSIWSLPYFRALGFTTGEFKGFTGVAADVFRDGLFGEVDLAGYSEKFRHVLTLDRLKASGLVTATGTAG
jgi:radical SAM PhpK family P-methyltransferase